MPYKAKEDPWIKTETGHDYAEGGGEEEYRCGTSRWSLAFPCFRRLRHYGKNHGQKWQIDEEEKEAMGGQQRDAEAQGRVAGGRSSDMR